MRKFIVSAITAAGMFSAPAQAADMPVKARVLAPASEWKWTGLYVGVVCGGGWGTSEQTAPGVPSTGRFDVSGGTVGGTLGFNWQRGPLVLGVEADYAWANMRGSTTSVCGVECLTELRSLGTARGRLGYSLGQLLPYLTGGYAFGNLRRGFGATSGSEFADGWTLGGGLEAMFAPHWSAKAEYLYVDLGNTNVPIAGFPTTVTFQTHLLRFGFNYRF